MISLSVIKIKIQDKKYMLTRHELDQVRELIKGLQSATQSETRSKLDAILGVKRKFDNGQAYQLILDTIKLGDTFYVWSTRRALTSAEVDRIYKLIACAVSSPNTLLTFPDYIVVSGTPPADKPKAKRKTKPDGK